MGGGILEHVRLRLLDIHDLASCAVEQQKICRLHRFGAVYLFYAREVGSGIVLDLRWVNRSGKPIEYGASYELFRRKDGKWEKIEAEPELIFPSIAYSINSGFTAELSYTIPAQYKLSPNERYRFQATFQFQCGSELSGTMVNSLEFEVKGEGRLQDRRSVSSDQTQSGCRDR